MENLLELLRTRRSIRKFKETQISPELVEQLMHAVLMSPASKRSNPWQFIMVDEPEMLLSLSECKKNGSQLVGHAALAVVVVVDPERSDVWIEDASIASFVLHLEAEDLGLGSCWVQIRERRAADGEDSEVVVRRLLGIPENLRVESMIAIGVKDELKNPFDESRLQWEKVHIGKFGQTK
ncbi:MAG: nitroreductase family protein [Bacteroidales bacterium]|nr:nitroreductase family protein [Bacteroidales bacterium]